MIVQMYLAALLSRMPLGGSHIAPGGGCQKARIDQVKGGQPAEALAAAATLFDECLLGVSIKTYRVDVRQSGANQP